MNNRRQTQQSRNALRNAIEGPEPQSLLPIRITTSRHTVRVVISFDEVSTDAEARKHFHNWLETFGHTSVSHGFEFLETET